MKVRSSHEYRNNLRYARVLLSPAEDDMLMGQKISYLTMDDLEALVELVTGVNPRHLAPPNYRPAR